MADYTNTEVNIFRMKRKTTFKETPHEACILILWLIIIFLDSTEDFDWYQYVQKTFAFLAPIIKIIIMYYTHEESYNTE